jgi:hypothetical protein
MNVLFTIIDYIFKPIVVPTQEFSQNKSQIFKLSSHVMNFLMTTQFNNEVDIMLYFSGS